MVNFQRKRYILGVRCLPSVLTFNMSSILPPHQAFSCLVMERAAGKGLSFQQIIVEMFLLCGTKLITLPIIEQGLEAMGTDERTRKEMHVSIYIDLYTLVSLDVCVYINVCGMCVHLNQWLRPFQVQGGYSVLPIPRGRCCLKQVFPCHQDLGILLFFHNQKTRLLILRANS